MCQGRCQRKCERFGFKKPATCGRRPRTTVTMLTVSSEPVTQEHPVNSITSPMVLPAKIVELSLEGETAPTTGSQTKMLARCA